MEVVNVLMALPGSCLLCGGASKQRYMDFRISLEFYGALYICDECFFAGAQLFGFMTPDQVSELKREVEEAREKLLDLEIKNSSLNQAVQSMATANFGNNKVMVVLESVSDSVHSFDSSTSDSSASVLEDSDISTEDSRDRTEQLDFGAGTSDESSDDEGVDKLRSNESSSDSLFSF